MININDNQSLNNDSEKKDDTSPLNLFEMNPDNVYQRINPEGDSYSIDVVIGNIQQEDAENNVGIIPAYDSIESVYKPDHELNTATGEMLSVVAHQLKTALTSIKINIDMLAQDLKADEQKFPSIIIVQREIKRLQYIVSNILTFSQHQMLQYSRFNISELFHDIMANVHVLVKSKSIYILDNIHGFMIDADYEKLREAVTHILTNAIEAVDHQGRIELSTDIDTVNYLLFITIHDNGPGIKTDENIFQPFYSTKSNGTGLGLFIAKNIIEQHKGLLTLQSSAGEGTTGVITLPLRKG